MYHKNPRKISGVKPQNFLPNSIPHLCKVPLMHKLLELIGALNSGYVSQEQHSEFEPGKAQYSTPNLFDRLFLIRAYWNPKSRLVTCQPWRPWYCRLIILTNIFNDFFFTDLRLFYTAVLSCRNIKKKYAATFFFTNFFVSLISVWKLTDLSS